MREIHSQHDTQMRKSQCFKHCELTKLSHQRAGRPLVKLRRFCWTTSNAAIEKAEQEGPGSARAAWNELKLLPSCTLSNNRDSKHRGKCLSTRYWGSFWVERSCKQKRSQSRKWHQQLAQKLQGHLQGKHQARCTVPRSSLGSRANSGNDAETCAASPTSRLT